MFPFVSKKEHANILLRHDCDGETVLYGLGVWVLFGEFLGLAFEVGTGFLDIVLQLLVHVPSEWSSTTHPNSRESR